MLRHPVPRALVLVCALMFGLAGAAFAQDATLEAELTYVGPGPASGTTIYRYDYTLTNNSVTPLIIELLVFFDSDPDSGVLFLGDNSDFGNTGGFVGTATGPSGWTADVFEDPDPSPWLVDFFNASGNNAIAPGETLSGFSVTFLYKGSGVPGEQFFEAINGYAHEGKSVVTTVNFPPISGTVTSTCGGGPLSGVAVDLYNSQSVLGASVTTNARRPYSFGNLPPDDYFVSISTPIGYDEPGDKEVVPGQTTDFDLTCLEFQNDPRTIGFWKHQVNTRLTGRGKPQVPLADLIAALDTITNRFANSPIHPVDVYNVPAGATTQAKLEAAQEILTVNKKGTMEERARQQLMALLLNVASLRLSQNAVVSADGRTASQAITYAWDLIADGNPGNDEIAKDIADEINNGHLVAAGIIPPGTPNYAYGEPDSPYAKVQPGVSLLAAFPNPVNAAGTQIRFSLGEAGSADLSIYDIQGRMVRTLLNGTVNAGETTVRWDGKGENGETLARGIYFYRLRAAGDVHTQKLVLVD